MSPDPYKKPSAAAAVAIFSRKDNNILVIRRKKEPFIGKYMFPGGFLDVDKEDIYDTAVREAEEETGAVVKKEDLILIDVRSDPKRDPRGHVIDVWFLCMLDETVETSPSTEEAFSFWIPLEDLKKLDYAFDHKLFSERVMKYIQRDTK